MPNARIKSMSFDAEQFPVSPQMSSFSVYQVSEEFLLVAKGPPSEVHNHTMLFDEGEEGSLIDAPEGDCTILVTRTGTVQNPMTHFSFKQQEKQHLKVVTLNNSEFLHAYQAAVLAHYPAIGATPGVKKEEGEFEYMWSMIYLQKLFAGVVEGNKSFWKRFHRDFDRSSYPVNVGIHMADIGRIRPIRVVYGGPDPKPVFQADI
jgi:hypothetical protein